jgi:hypothetical protein
VAIRLGNGELNSAGKRIESKLIRTIKATIQPRSRVTREVEGKEEQVEFGEQR